jgi:alkylhydroperoxidase family enzyme
MHNQGHSITDGKPLVPPIDIWNADAEHDANAELLRNFEIKRNVFATLARSPGLFVPVMELLKALLNGNSRKIQILDYQLIVLRMASTIGAEYVFGINEPVSRFNGMGEERIEALRKGLPAKELFEMGIWSERQQCLITLLDESLATWTNKPETIAWAQKLLSDDEVVEVFITLGFFSMVARMAIGLRVQQDPPIPDLDKHIAMRITKNSDDTKEA